MVESSDFKMLLFSLSPCLPLKIETYVMSREKDEPVY